MKFSVDQLRIPSEEYVSFNNKGDLGSRDT